MDFEGEFHDAYQSLQPQVQELVPEYLQSLLAEMENFHSDAPALSSGADWERWIHNLSGTAPAFGLGAMVEMAKSIRTDFQSNEPVYASAEFADLRRRLQKLVATLSRS